MSCDGEHDGILNFCNISFKFYKQTRGQIRRINLLQIWDFK